MFNTYNEFKSDSDTYLDVKKALPVDIDSDPAIKDICNFICNETPGATIFSCEGHGKEIRKEPKLSLGYVRIHCPNVDWLEKVLSDFEEGVTKIVDPAKAKGEVSWRMRFGSEYDLLNKNVTLRWLYRTNDRTHSLRLINRVLRHAVS